MWGPYNRSWRKLKEATRPTRFYGKRGPATDIGPVTLHAKGRRHRDDRGFEIVAGAYVAAMIAGVLLGPAAKVIGPPFGLLFFIIMPSVTIAGAIRILAVHGLRLRGALLAVPLLAVGLPLAYLLLRELLVG